MKGYTVVRCKRKSLLLKLDRAGNVVVRAPLRTSDAQIEAFVSRHRLWLEKRLRERAERKPLGFADGESLELFGRTYVVATGRVRLAEGTIFLPAENRKEALERLLKRHALAVMSELTERIALRHRFRYAKVKIGSAATRWGSCSRAGNINYTFRIVFLPMPLCEYVAVHELCHTRVFSHGERFWAEVEQIMPDWRARRKALKAIRMERFL